MNNKIQELYDEFCPLSLNSFWEIIKKEKVPNIRKKDLDKFWKSLDTRITAHVNKSLMGIYYSNIPNTWQMDIYIKTKNNPSKSIQTRTVRTPANPTGSTSKRLINNFLLFINYNTKFIVVYPMNNKSSFECMRCLKMFIDEYNPRRIFSDNDRSFTRDMEEYCKARSIYFQKSVTRIHNELSILNSACNIIGKYIRRFPRLSLVQIVEKYNNTPRVKIDGMKFTPKEVNDNSNLETHYIFDKQLQSDIKYERMKFNEIPVGSKVRYILDDDLDEKKFNKKYRQKNRLSSSYYIVDEIVSPYKYILRSKDGTRKIVARYRLFPYTGRSLKEGAKFKDDRRGILKNE